MRSFNPPPGSLKNNYGPGLTQRLQQQLEDENGMTVADNPELAATALSSMNPDPLVMRLRRKRMSALRKQILTNGGYGDLAKMVSFRHEEE